MYTDIQMYYPRTEILRFCGEVLRHFSAASGKIQDSCGSHVCCFHVMGIVKATLAAGAAGAAASSTAHIAAAARRIAAGCAAGWARILTVTFSCGNERGQE